METRVGDDEGLKWLSASQSSIVTSELAMDMRTLGERREEVSGCCGSVRRLRLPAGELRDEEGSNSKSSSQFSEGSRIDS